MKAQHLFLATAVGAFFFLAGEDPGHLTGETAVQQAAAQQMGRQPWGWSRNKSLAAQFQHADRNGHGSGGGGGAGNVTQYVTNYNSSSTAIGNYTQIEQILSGNAQGSLDYLANQKSTGNQGADAQTDVEINNSVAEASGEGSTASAGGTQKGDKTKSKAKN